MADDRKKHQLSDLDRARKRKTDSSQSRVRNNKANEYTRDSRETASSRVRHNTSRDNSNNRKHSIKDDPIKLSNKKRNPNSSSNSFILLISFLSIIFCVYGAVFIYNYITNDTIDTMIVENIKITKNDWQKAVIIRDENIYKASSEMVNKYVHIYNINNDRVKVGQALATVFDEALAETNDEIEITNDKNFNIQNYNEEYLMYQTEIDNIDEVIQSDIDLYDTNDYLGIIDLKNSISSQLDNRNQIIINTSSNQVSSLVLENLGDDIQGADNIYAEKSGIFTKSIDGLEETINYDTMEELTEDQTKMESEYVENSLLDITENENLFRVIESTQWYVGVYLESDIAKNLSVGDDVHLYTDNNTDNTIRTKVYYIKDNLEEKSYVIFENTGDLLNYINRRSILIALDKEIYNSIKIPETAIAYKEMIKIPASFVYDNSVIKVTDELPQSITPITVWGYSDDELYCLVEREKNSIKYGDKIISAGEDKKEYLISESENIGGVYVVNDNVARFKKVSINEDIEKIEDYIYINSNEKLKTHDRIIINSDGITDNMLIN